MLKLSDEERNQEVFQHQQKKTLPRIAFRHANVKTQGGYSQRKETHCATHCSHLVKCVMMFCLV